MRDLSNEQKRKLLKIARKAIIHYLKNKELMEVREKDRRLNEPRGVFVTLKLNGLLRGCIGNIMPREKLFLAVRNMAVESAFKDPRFPPLDEKELNKLEIEISVLSLPEKIDSADDIELGEHGVIVKSGFRQGVFLPQVAEEAGWNKEEFLGNLCCSKAALSYDAWKDPNTELYVFKTQVFNEKGDN